MPPCRSRSRSPLLQRCSATSGSSSNSDPGIPGSESEGSSSDGSEESSQRISQAKDAMTLVLIQTSKPTPICCTLHCLYLRKNLLREPVKLSAQQTRFVSGWGRELASKGRCLAWLCDTCGNVSCQCVSTLLVPTKINQGVTDFLRGLILPLALMCDCHLAAADTTDYHSQNEINQS